MKINIVGRNTNVSDRLKDTIEKKVGKLGKYFSDEIEADVVLTEQKNKKKTEVTIKARNMTFRAEDRKSPEFYDGIDEVVGKLSSQMSRFKDKVQKRHKDNKSMKFEQWPDQEEAIEEVATEVARKKEFELTPMTVDEAVLQMEMLGHNFFVFLNMETDSVNVVYKRSDKDYGLLETTY